MLRMTDGKQRIALLIDADNASARNIDIVLAGVDAMGTPTSGSPTATGRSPTSRVGNDA